MSGILECKFYRDYQRCKYGEWCHFAHIKKETEIQKIKLENENMKSKLSELETKMHEKDKVVEYILEKLTQLEEKVENVKKDGDIEQIECETHEMTFFNPSAEVSEEESDFIEHIIDHETDSNVTTIEPELNGKFKCNLCSFETKYCTGLKSHITKMHPDKNH